MLSGFPVALDFLGQRPFVDFGRAVIDAEGADLAKGVFDDGLSGEAGASHHLHAAIGDPHQRFRYRHLAIELSAVSSEPVSSTSAHQSIISSRN